MKHPIKILPSPEVLRECFRYDESTGKLFWLHRPVHHFGSEKAMRIFNTRLAGKEAASNNSGYLVVRLFGMSYKVHRIIWKLANGTEPPAILDHEDRKRASNKSGNLRAASYGQNFINRTETWGTTGHIGVKKTRNGTWEARIHKNKKYIHLDTFPSKAQAVEARRKAAKELYGVFAP